MDKIDRALAGHYGFPAEEPDVIINYGITYRMEHNSEDEEEE